MIIRELLAKLGFAFDDADWKKADSAVSKVKLGLFAMAGAGVAAATALGAAVVKTANAAAEIEALAQRTGIGADALQELRHAADLSASSGEALTAGLTAMARVLRSVAEGSPGAGKAFAELGIDVRKADGTLRGADDILTDVADRFSKMPDGLRKTGLAMELLGRGGSELIPMLNKGADGLAELRLEARELGIVLDKDTLEAGARMNDMLDRLHALVRGLVYTLAGPLLEPLGDVVEEIVAWARANREVIKSRIEGFIRALVAGVRALVVVVKFARDNFRLLAILLGSVLLAALWANIAAVITATSWYAALGVAAVVAALEAAAAWVVALWPLALLALAIAAIILILEDLYVWLQGGDSLFGEVAKKWIKPLEEAFTDFFAWMVKKAVETAQILVTTLSGGAFTLGDAQTAFAASVAAKRLAGGAMGGNLGLGVLGAAQALGPGAMQGLAGFGTSVSDFFGPAKLSEGPQGKGHPMYGGGAVDARTTVHVHPGPGMDEEALAQKVGTVLEEKLGTVIREAGEATK